MYVIIDVYRGQAKIIGFTDSFSEAHARHDGHKTYCFDLRNLELEVRTELGVDYAVSMSGTAGRMLR